MPSMSLSACPTTSPWTRLSIGFTYSIRCAKGSRTSRPAAASRAKLSRGKSRRGDTEAVIWTSRARADLRGIHAYISKSSRIRARRIVRELACRADVLSLPPFIGRRVPEIASVARVVVRDLRTGAGAYRPRVQLTRRSHAGAVDPALIECGAVAISDA